MKLIVAIATKGVKDVSGGTLRVDADEGWPGMNVSKNQGNCSFGVTMLTTFISPLERQQAKRCPASGKTDFGNLS
jgi:hypothetical protein